MAGHKPWSTLTNQLSPQRRRRVASRVEQLELGMLLAKLRKQAGLTQQQLAERLGVSQPSISQMEAGDEMYVTSLSRVIAELGGDVVLRMPGGDVNLSETMQAQQSLGT
jgi:DNA-binding XRE family transcriptional regulator